SGRALLAVMDAARSLLPLLTAVTLLGSASLAEAAEPDAPDSLLNRRDRPVAVRLHAEVGFVSTLDNRLKLGADGTYVDLRRDMGQDTLFFFGRLSGDLDIGRRRKHSVVLLWQPLDFRSQAVTDRDLRIEDAVIPADTPVNFRYGFPFWRGSYLYDFFEDEREVAIGAGLQIRNANLEYATQDGTVLRSARDVGPVPLLKFRGRGYVYRDLWVGGEIDGFYAPIRYINGGSTDVEGLIVDASLRVGLSWAYGTDTFLNVRYVAGGAQGTSSDPMPFSDGFNKNWLQLLSVSLGFSLR
ncbi:MAG: hypothetical protein AB1Z98_14385, partial [Nannocystaceae bacterium]